MAKSIGRATIIAKAGTPIAGVRTKSIAWGGESIDVTSNENGGVRVLLPESSQEQLDISFDGVEDDYILRNISINPEADKMLTDITYTLDDGTVISGNFRLSSYELGSPYNEGTTFSCTLESSGSWTVTAP